MPQHRGRAFPRSPQHPTAPILGSFSRVRQDGAYEQYSPGSVEFSPPGASVSRQLFSAHKEDGDQVRRQICEECGSTFVSKAHKLIHLRTVHEKQRVHICTYDNCQKSFGQAGSLSRYFSFSSLPFEDTSLCVRVVARPKNRLAARHLKN